MLKETQLKRNGKPFGKPFVHHRTKLYFVNVSAVGSEEEYQRQQKKKFTLKYQEQQHAESERD